jgi:chromosome segregation ATPase
MQDVMVPMLNDLNGAVQMLQTDRTGACTAAKSAEARVDEADRRLNALYAKVKAEGRDLGRFDELLAKLRELKTQVPDFAAKVCDGSLATAQAQDDDPATKAAEEKVMTLLRRYTNDMTAATDARNAGDTAKACLSLKDGLATLDELDAYMHELAKTYAHTAADDEELRNIYAQIQTWRTQTLDAAKDCPAS